MSNTPDIENQDSNESSNENPEETLETKIFNEISIHNLKLLSNIKDNEKLFLDEEGKIHLDERYLQNIRRTMDGSSRYDVMLPLFNSYLHGFIRYDDLTNDEKNLLIKSVSGLEILKNTYHDFMELNNFFENIKDTLENIQNLKNKTKEMGVNCDILKPRRCRKKYKMG